MKIKWLYKLFNIATPEEQKGISLKNPKWEVSSLRDMPAFLRTLIDIIPEDSIMYLEGGSPDIEIKTYLEEQKSSNPTKIALGTIWPRPKYYHIPFTPENINGFAEIMEHHATPEGVIHLHIYKNSSFA